MILKKLDLRGTPCPVNFVRCRLAIEKLEIDEKLEDDISKIKESGDDLLKKEKYEAAI